MCGFVFHALVIETNLTSCIQMKHSKIPQTRGEQIQVTFMAVATFDPSALATEQHLLQGVISTRRQFARGPLIG